MKPILSLFRMNKRQFSIVGAASSLLNGFIRENTGVRIEKYNHCRPLENFKALNFEQKNPKYKTSKLPNGIMVLTESEIFPSNICLGVCISAGSRDETMETSGSCFALKNTYMKTANKRNETLNYVMLQMSGGEFTMEYDREVTYYKSHCLSEDVVHILPMMIDCALEPRSEIAANVGILKNKNLHLLINERSKMEETRINEIILNSAFGNETLGMPLSGFEYNNSNLSSKILAKYMMDNYFGDRIIVSATGIRSHEEFADLVYNLTKFIPNSPPKTRNPSVYLGGDYREAILGTNVSISFAFNGCSWRDPDYCSQHIMNALIGNAQGFSTGGPGKGMFCRAKTNLVGKNEFIYSASALNLIFSDNGIFGLTLSGNKDYAKEIYQLGIKEIIKLKGAISDEELNRAKNLSKLNILLAMERNSDRLEEITKGRLAFGDLVFDEYLKKIDQVTSKSIHNVVEKMFAKKPTVVCIGENINSLPNSNELQKALK